MAGNSAKEIEAGRAFVRIGADDGPLTKTLKTAANKVIGFGLRVQSIGTSLAAAGTSITAPLVASVEGFARAARDMHQLSIETGLSVEWLSKLAFAAEASGAGADVLNSSLVHLNRLMIEGSMANPQALEVFRMLRLSWQQLQSLSPEERFLAVAEAISRYGNVQARVHVAQMALGNGAAALVPLMSRGAGGIRQLTDEATHMGFVLSTEAAESSRELLRDLAALANGIKVATMEIVGGLVPGVREAYVNDRSLGQAIAQIGRGIGSFLAANKELVKWLVVGGLGAVALGGAIKGLGTVLPVVVKALWSLSGASAVFAFIASPLGLFVMGLVAAGAAVVIILDAMGELDGVVRDFGQAWQIVEGDFSDAWGAITDSIMSGDFAGAMRVAWALARLEWARGTTAVRSTWRDMWAGLMIVTNNVSQNLDRFFTISLAGWLLVWQEALMWMRRGWLGLTTALSIVWLALVTSLRILWQPVAELFGAEHVDVRAQALEQARQLQQMGAEEDRRIDAQHDEANARISRNTEAELERSRRAQRVTTAGIVAQNRPDRRDADLQANVDSAVIDFNNAREAASIEAAQRRARREEETRRQGRGGNFGLPAGLSGSRGTFSGAALSGLVSAQNNPVVDAINRQADQQREQGVAINEIRDMMRRGGGVAVG